MVFSADETTNVGDDTGSPVTNDYKAGSNSFSGTIDWVRIDIGTDTQDHLLSRKIDSNSQSPGSSGRNWRRS